MLCALCSQSETSTERFLSAVQSSCFAQQTADLNHWHQVPWSRHFLNCLRGILVADLLIWSRALAFNPPFQHLFSPDAIDLELGGVQSWPLICADWASPNPSTSIKSLWHGIIGMGATPGSAVCYNGFRRNHLGTWPLWISVCIYNTHWHRYLHEYKYLVIHTLIKIFLYRAGTYSTLNTYRYLGDVFNFEYLWISI